MNVTKKLGIIGLVCLSSIIIWSCKNEVSNHTIPPNKVIPEGLASNVFSSLPASETGFDFNNFIPVEQYIYFLEYEYIFNGGGVATGDINNDGLADIMMVSTTGQNKLYLNKGNLKFQDISVTANINVPGGFKTGATMVDINQDGFLDIYLCKSSLSSDENGRKNCLFINNGDLTFTEKADEYGLGDKSFSTQAYFVDIDLDDDLDMYLVNHPVNWGQQNKLSLQMDTYGNISVIKDTAFQYVSDRLYINNGGKFVDKTKAYDIENKAFGLSSLIYDFNNDQYPDILTVNDYVAPDRLLINNKGQGFDNQISKYFKNIGQSSMGSDLFDINNDGEMDLFVAEMMATTNENQKKQASSVNYDAYNIGRKYGYHDPFRYNTLQVASGNNTFSNVAFLTETYKTDWSWGVLGEDFDHNGFEDLFVTNGFLKDILDQDYSKFRLDSLKKTGITDDILQRWLPIIDSLPATNTFYANMGGLQLVEATAHWGIKGTSFSSGSAYADLDNDGDLEIIVSNINEDAHILKNNTMEAGKSSYTSIEFEGPKVTFGTKAKLTLSNGQELYEYFYPIKGFISSSEHRLHFAYPNTASPTSLIVTWPNGITEQFTEKLTGHITITKGQGKPYEKKKSISTLFVEDVSPYKHEEKEYIDFKREPLLHLKQSVEGPFTMFEDIDGDGKDELIAGGGQGQPTAIFSQSNGKWNKKNIPALLEDAVLEDTDGCVVDIDKDGDNDLIILSGGYEFPQGNPNYNVRIYLNDGKGNFSKMPDLSQTNQNANAIVALDADHNGTMDLFIGAGAIPGSYPKAGNSYFLINHGGSFSVNVDMLPNRGEIGIIKSASIGDVNKDGKPELVVAREWGSVGVLSYENRVYKDISDGVLQNNIGWWQHVLVTDIDGDGDNDIVGGNVGMNSFFKASQDRPTCIYYGDFDQNGENDPILCTFIGDKSYPVHSRDELLDHMTSLRKKYLRYAQYANHQIEDIFGHDVIKNTPVIKATEFASCVFYNNGDGSFTKEVLPVQAQLSMMQASIYEDVDDDGSKELVCTGNFWDTDFDFGKYDASTGTVLRYNTVSKAMVVVPSTGLFMDGNVRDVSMSQDGTIATIDNNGPLRIYRKK